MTTKTKTVSTNDYQRVARLNRTLGVLVSAKIKSNILLETLRLGYPYFADSSYCPTSMVQITPDGRIRYVWNREFFDKCSDLAVQYVCMHEALHVVLNHLLRRGDRHPMIWNVAADAIINNILDKFYSNECHRLPPEYHNFGLDEVLKGRVDPHQIEDNLDIDDLDRVSTEQLYDRLDRMAIKVQVPVQGPSNQQGQQGQKAQGSDGQSGTEGKGGQEGNGEGNGENDKEGKGLGVEVPEIDKYGKLDVHDGWSEKLSPETQKALDDLRQQAKDEKDNNGNGHSPSRRGGKRKGSGWGDLTGGILTEIGEVAKEYGVPWDTLLKCTLHSAKKLSEADNWTRPHRKMYSTYPDILLPGPHENIAPTASVLVAIDTSGSMGDEQIAQLVGIIQTLPEDKYDIHIVWFDTELYEATDLTKPYGRGGTSFQSIEDVAAGKRPIYPSDYGVDPYSYYRGGQKSSLGETLSVYPDLIVVMTDGEAATPKIEHPNRWTAVITPEGITDYFDPIKEMSIWRL
jgi:predicted metal-dependent peptidase